MECPSCHLMVTADDVDDDTLRLTATGWTVECCWCTSTLEVALTIGPREDQ